MNLHLRTIVTYDDNDTVFEREAECAGLREPLGIGYTIVFGDDDRFLVEEIEVEAATGNIVLVDIAECEDKESWAIVVGMLVENGWTRVHEPMAEKNVTHG